MIDPVSNANTVWRKDNTAATGQGNGAFAQMVAAQEAGSPKAAPVGGTPLLQKFNFMSEVYGDAWNAETNKVDFKRFLANTARRTDAFGDKLQERMRDAGIDTTGDIKLIAAGDGSVKVDGDHPDKDRIEKMFADDPAFTEEYRRVAGANEWAAAAQVTGAYTEAYNACTNNSERDAVWSRFFGYEQQLEKEGGKMTLSNGTLTSGAMAALAQISQSAGLNLT